jgi:adenylate cyclase
VDLGAWALYREGHAIPGQKGWSEESFAEAAELLRQAIRQDPELAFAHAYLSLILAMGHLVGLVGGESWRDEAIAAAETAIALDSQDTDVLGYVGCAFADMGDVQRGIGILRRAVELDPSNAQAVAALGAALSKSGDEQGIEYMQHGMRISPRDSRLSAWGALLARALLNFGKVDEAIDTAANVCRCDDKIFLPRVVLAIAQMTAGNAELARTALADARRIRPHLSYDDISRLAGPAEMELLIASELLEQ